jgi:hypothetical protein
MEWKRLGDEMKMKMGDPGIYAFLLVRADEKNFIGIEKYPRQKKAENLSFSNILKKQIYLEVPAGADVNMGHAKIAVIETYELLKGKSNQKGWEQLRDNAEKLRIIWGCELGILGLSRYYTD